SSALPHTWPTNMSAGVIVCLISLSPTKMICQESPYLSCSHPYLSLHGYAPSSMSAVPLSDNLLQSASTSSFVLHLTWNEMDGLNLKSGPALIALNCRPESSNETISQSPDGVLWRVLTFVTFEFVNEDA